MTKARTVVVMLAAVAAVAALAMAVDPAVARADEVGVAVTPAAAVMATAAATAAATPAQVAVAASARPPAATAPDGRRERQILARLKRDLSELEALTRYAAHGRKAFDLDCVTRRAATARVLVRLGDSSLADAAEAARQGNAAEASYQLGRVPMLADKMNAEKRDARRCVDDDLSSVQTLQRGLEQSAGLPDFDPAAPPRPPGTPAQLPKGAPM